MTDLTATRIRRRLETLQLPVPRPEVLEEIVDFIARSDAWIAVTDHQHAVDEAVAGATNSDLDAHHFHRGYRQALDDIEELGEGNTSADSGPTAA